MILKTAHENGTDTPESLSNPKQALVDASVNVGIAVDCSGAIFLANAIAQKRSNAQTGASMQGGLNNG
jgi:hypothetical protein